MEINLLPRRQSFFQPAWILWGITCLTFAVAITTVPITYYKLRNEKTNLQQQETKLSAQQSTLQAQLTKVDPRIEQLKQYQAELQRLNLQQVDWQSRLNDLSNQLPENGAITKFSYQTASVTLSGQLDSIKTIAQYAELLKNLSWIQSVSIKSISHKMDTGSGTAASLVDSSGTAYTFAMTIQTNDPQPTQNQQGSAQNQQKQTQNQQGSVQNQQGGSKP